MQYSVCTTSALPHHTATSLVPTTSGSRDDLFVLAVRLASESRLDWHVQTNNTKGNEPRRRPAEVALTRARVAAPLTTLDLQEQAVGQVAPPWPPWGLQSHSHSRRRRRSLV